MKRLLCLILCLACALFVASCGDKEPISLEAPTLAINDNVASWSKIEGAVGYEYKIDDKDAVFVNKDVLKIHLLSGERVVVRAIGDGEKHLDSDWSESVAFINETKLPKPTITTKAIGTQLIVKWDAVANATGYEYRLNAGSETPISESSFLISASDTFYLRAKGDGELYIDSDWAIVSP